MAKIQLGLTGHNEPHDRESRQLSPRDISDALRLIQLLLYGQNRIANGDVDQTPAVLMGGSGKSLAKAQARRILKQRRARARHLPASMFSEPAWDMLLTLYAVEENERRLTVTGLAELCGAPLTTLVRWLDTLEQQKLIERVASRTDRRVSYLDLAPLGREKLDAYFADIDLLRI
ncbi:MAG: MarR family transcriptional regulator [Sphingomicrobium sp.]